MTTYTESEIYWIIRKFKLLLILCGIFLAVMLLLIVLQYLGVFEDELRYRTPEGPEDSLSQNIDYAPLNCFQGQVVYVPAYSHIYHQDGRSYLLTVTLSVRNTSAEKEIIVKSVRYFDTNGKEIKSYLKAPIRLAAMATTESLIERDDTSGGSGANFLVEWVSDQAVTEPVIEAGMIDTSGQQGISFARKGQVVSEVLPDSGSGDFNESNPSASTTNEK